ncbi:hypothetical protein Avbf_14019 [Armadillidium vulgare]|nr:hypothetical protein Avbf_14019 [Armadillidium vulgare]
MMNVNENLHSLFRVHIVYRKKRIFFIIFPKCYLTFGSVILVSIQIDKKNIILLNLKPFIISINLVFVRPSLVLNTTKRFLLLYKYGGIYLDMDVFVLKNLQKEENFAGLESQEKVNSAIMGFRKGHPFLNDCITEITKPLRCQ